ncbi:translational activator of cytochrome c oxidase [Plakobranchus ocellatus]|uniref:Translational activator of cytochrome c oxidase n=1 Tax=Plakobranchus ocellatus TaxID=259542 RepID=A0AAV4DKG5_9GAST|nr:translational activator of cytochrome c oxidase [Plakobranchus ocellatus]
MKSSMLAQRVQQVLHKNPEKDPKLNTELANLIKWARTNNIPNDTVEKTIDRQVKLRDPKAITIIDGRGPANTGVVMECFSLKPQHTRGLLQGVVKKYGFNLNSSALDLFEHSGFIEVSLPEDELSKAANDPDAFCLDKYIDMAIEASAEEVTLEMGLEKPYLQFKCPPFELSRVQKCLEDLGLTVISSERTYIPTTVVPVSQEFLETLDKMSDKLDLHPDVIKYYFNVRPENS